MQGGILWVCAHYIHPCMWANVNVINIPNSGFFENGDVRVIFRFIHTPRKVREMVLWLREKENLGGGGGGENITLTSRQLNVGKHEGSWDSFFFALPMVQKKLSTYLSSPQEQTAFFCSYSP